ncbi:MAG: hypothetical protein Q9M32_04865 [Sulfurimonas sp.]|nr:hypothetical protein [Sulfurimonas sp.]
MDIYDIKNKIATTVFTHEMLSDILIKSFANVNEKISQMLKKEDIIRLKRGIYFFNPRYQTMPVDKISAANMLYAPSYISFEYALSYYGLIPERVYEVTSATLGLKKKYETPIGRFSYKKVSLKVFSIGVDWLYDDKLGGRLIATKEKALCDKLKSERKLGVLSQKKLWDYLLYDLRVEEYELFKLDINLLYEIAIAYNSKILKNLVLIIKKRKKNV